MPVHQDTTERIGIHRPDLVVEGRVLVEIKSVERFIGAHSAQALAYMRLWHPRTGLLLNFNTEVLYARIKRLVI